MSRDKTNKMSVHPAKTQISLGIRPVWSESPLSAWRQLGSLATHWAHSEDSDQTGRILCRFCHEAAHMSWSLTNLQNGLCTQQRLRSACTITVWSVSWLDTLCVVLEDPSFFMLTAKTDQTLWMPRLSLHWAHTWSKAKTLIRLCWCPGWVFTGHTCGLVGFVVPCRRLWCQEMSRLMTKPTKWRAPREDSDQPGHPPNLITVFTMRSAAS